MSCIKYLMFVFNFVFVVCGIALIVVGGVVQGKDFTQFLNSKYVTAPTILIVVGVIIFVLAFLGCYGSVRENHCMVMTFGILLFIIFVVEIAGGITAYVNRHEVENILRDSMNTTFQQNKKDFTPLWKEMQSKWECCGLEGPLDYEKMYGNNTLPNSCCPSQTDPLFKCDNQDKEHYKQGCYPIFLDRVRSAVGVIGGVAIGIAVIELIGVMFSCCLASAIKKEYEGV